MTGFLHNSARRNWDQVDRNESAAVFDTATRSRVAELAWWIRLNDQRTGLPVTRWAADIDRPGDPGE